ncbi:MAG: helix-turn-helix domain-containing protein [Clostridia bacterium]|nr:helix-turn-helix domain-containing protein [Clostridia bacterium]
MYGQRIKELRLKQGLTQQQLAEKIGTTQKAISKYETEFLDLSTDMLIKLSKYFKESSDYILGIETEDGKKIYD